MKILVAMSGGVDSSVAAALLKEQGEKEGFEIAGVTLKLWGGEQDSGCCSLSDVEDARRVAAQLDIPHYIFSYTEEFDRDVVDFYVQSYEKGLTPNPCIECNRKIKFKLLHERAVKMGFDKIATGHHAQVIFNSENGSFQLKRGEDILKDQSYVLHMADQKTLSQTILPIGHLNKNEVRQLAEKYGLRTAQKAESMDVCFIKKGARGDFLSERLQIQKKGDVVSTEGEKLGEHDGLHNFTLGQRRGLKISDKKRTYVVEKNLDTGEVTLGDKEDLLVKTYKVDNCSWVYEIPKIGTEVNVQIRAHQKPYRATVKSSSENSFEVELSEKQTKVAPGQSIVLYREDYCLGGAVQ